MMQYKASLDKWEFRAGIRKDLMTLLSGLHNVTALLEWKGATWKRVCVPCFVCFCFGVWMYTDAKCLSRLVSVIAKILGSSGGCS